MSGSVIRVPGWGIGYGDLAHVVTPTRKLLAQAIRLQNGFVDLQVFAGASGVSTGDRVEFLGRQARVSCGANTLGRVFDGVGNPRDKGPPLYGSLRPLDREPVNPARRIKASRMLETGIPMIDVFNTLVESQKISIFCGPGEPHNELLARIALQARADVIVLGGIGLRSDDYLYFKEQFERAGVASRSVLFIHTAADPVVECLLTPDMALTVAEEFALEGKRTLVALTDMTNFCDALKEVSIVLDRVPSNRGYPGELYSQLATRYEKAVDFDGAGSITIISVTTMPGDDVTHPAPDNTGYITEGQYYLKNRRIEPFGSLSRLKQLANQRTREDHRYLMNEMIRLYADYQETLEKQAMGFRMSPWDGKLLRYGGLFEERLMDWTVDVPLLRALDIGWEILATCFKPEETGLRRELIHRFWPQNLGS